MITKLFSYSGHLEVAVRGLLYRFPNLKRNIKNKVKRQDIHEQSLFNDDLWNRYKEKVDSVVNTRDIIIVHSSLDGLKPIGVDTQKVLDYLLSLLAKDCTVVLPAYAASSTKVIDGRLKTYDPQRSPCWTGMLPNYFLRTSGVIRTVFPYNSLAAIGPCAIDMMSDNDRQEFVYGDHSAWKYCVDHNAKILFIGTTSNASNTIQSHMIPDVMKEEWPIKDWYQKVTASVREDGVIKEKTIYIQKKEWVKYIADYHITRKLIKNHILIEETVSGCPFGYINSSKKMVDYLVELARKGDLSYIVPRKRRK